MYHFTLLNEASTEKEHQCSKQQEITTEKAIMPSNKTKNLLKKTGLFLHRYLEQTNGFRIFISKN